MGRREVVTVGGAAKMRVALLGDSIAGGLGVDGACYLDVIGTATGATTSNYARSAMQVKESLNRLPDLVRFSPDVVIVAHGMAEAIVRPTATAMRLVPPRWRRAGWLDPRPYFSHAPVRGRLQRLESAVRWRVKVALINAWGGASWCGALEFEDALRRLVETILSQGPRSIVLVSHTGIDERFFPRSVEALDAGFLSMQRVAKEHSDRVASCDVRSVCDRWDDFFADHLHPNASGHGKIARAILDCMRHTWPDLAFQSTPGAN